MLIEGRTEKSHSKTTPLKPSKDIKVPQSSSGKSDKGPKGASNGKLSKTTTKRSMSFTNISNIKPKSPYRESETTTTTNTESRRNSIVDSETLREQIYYDWLQQKSNKTKEEIKELRRRDKEKENEAEKEKENKKIMVSSFAYFSVSIYHSAHTFTERMLP